MSDKSGVRFGVRIHQGGYTYEDLRRVWIEADRLGYFSATLYDLYVTWAQAEGHSRQSHVTFGRDAAAYFRSVGIERKRDGKAIKYVGVEISPDAEQELQGRSPA